MNLKDSQFLKIRLTEHGDLYFEIYEKPIDKWRRPNRWSIIVGSNRFRNRRSKESKFKLIIEILATLRWSFLEHFHCDELWNMINVPKLH